MKLYKSIKTALAAKEEVTHLKLTLSGELPVEIQDLKNLKEIYLDGNCSSISALNSLSRLELISMTLPRLCEGLKEILKLPRLKNLKLIGAEIENFEIPLDSELSPLQSLTVKDCSLKELPQAVGKLSLLTEMNLDSNELTDLPEGFKNLRHLKRLNLDRNKLNLFPPILSELKSLKHLSLDGNPFSDEEKARIQRLYHLTVH